MIAELDYNSSILVKKQLITANFYVEPDNTVQTKSMSLSERVLDFFIIKSLTKKITRLNDELSNGLPSFSINVSDPNVFESFVSIHSSMIDTLDKFSSLEHRIKKIESESIKTLANETIRCINLLKEYELKIRVLLYPERNEVLLTFDELKELSELQKDWERNW